MLKKLLILLTFTAMPLTSQAALIDFTDRAWSSVIDGSSNSASLGGITLYSAGGNLTFNAGDKGGCVDGKNAGAHSLACAGDGIGVRDDEITQGGNLQLGHEGIRVVFDNQVNITDILLLDLFGKEYTGEKAVIGEVYGPQTVYHSLADNGGIGGYFSTGYTGTHSYIDFLGYGDRFSDYALAGIEVSPVPLPGAVFLFGSALLGFMGFMGFKRFSNS